MKRRVALTAMAGTFIGTAGYVPFARSTGKYPDRPVKIVLSQPAGNPLDIAFRAIADLFRASTGQPLVVDNRPGGQHVIAATNVLSAPADGYTLLASNNSMLTINPFTMPRLPYSAERNFRPIGTFAGTGMVVATLTTVPADDLKGLLKLAAGKSESASYATFGPSAQFLGFMLNRHANGALLQVPFNGSPPAVQSLLAGQVTFALVPYFAIKPHMDAGRVKVLAVSHPTRIEALPSVPTLKEAGVPDGEMLIWAGVSVRVETPDEVCNYLNAEFKRILLSGSVQERFRHMDLVPMPSTAEEFRRLIEFDTARWADVVRQSGFKVYQ